MSTNGSSQGSHGSKSISTIESELEIMTKRLDSTSKEKELILPKPVHSMKFLLDETALVI